MGNFTVHEAQIAGETVYGIKNSAGERVSTRYTNEGVQRDLEELEYEARKDSKYREQDMADLDRIKQEIAERVFAKSLQEFEVMQEEKQLKEIADRRLGIIKSSGLTNEEMDSLLNECAEREGSLRLGGAFLETPEETRDRLAKELTGKLTVADFSELSDEEKEEDPLFQFSKFVIDEEAELESGNEVEKEDVGALDADIL